jgi:tetratricopeptide (TPR) repeat protein
MDEITVDETGDDYLLACAARLVRTLDGVEYSDVSENLALQFVENDQWDSAVELADKIADPYTRDHALGAIVARSVQANISELPKELLEIIEDPVLRELAIEQVAIKYAEVGSFEESLEMVDQLGDNSLALSNIALMYGAKGLHEDGEALARTIEFPGPRATALSQLATKATKDGRMTDANDLLDDASAAADEIEFTDRIYALLGIASACEDIGNRERALDNLSLAYKLCSDSERSPTEMTSVGRSNALAHIAGGFARSQSFEKADSIIEEIGEPNEFIRACIELAVEYQKVGELANAKDLLGQSLEIIKEEPAFDEMAINVRDGLIAELAMAYAVCDEYEEALQVALMIRSSAQQLATGGAVGRISGRDGLTERLFHAAESFSDSHIRASYWLGLSDALIEAQQSESASKSLSQAMESAYLIKAAYDRAVILSDIAFRFAGTEHLQRAREVFSEVIATIKVVEGNYLKARLLLLLASQFRKLGLETNERERQLLLEITLQLE